MKSQMVSQPTSTPPDFDWQSGRATFPLVQGSSEAAGWSLVVCGDWAPGAEQLQAAFANPLSLYGDLLPILQEADLSVVNLECVLADNCLEPIAKDGIAIQLPAGAGVALSSVPFHLACLANNHSLDYGSQGLTKTLQVLERHHIRSVGAGLCVEEAEKPVIFQLGDTRLAIVNVAEGEEARSIGGGPGVASLDLPRLRVQLPLLRTRVDVLVIVVHAGREYLPVPAPYIRDIYRSLADAGASLVVGHHPHVAQGIELYNGVPIIYSLGNFVFSMDTPVASHYLGYCLKARFYGSQLRALELRPYRNVPSGLSLLAGEQLADFLLQLKESSAIIVDDDRLAAVWDAYADSWLVHVGIQELANNVGLLGGEALLIQSVLKVFLHRLETDHIAHRLIRPAIWRAIHWLEKKIRSAQTLSDPTDLSRMKHSAAILRNRFDTLAHRELYLTALRHAQDGKLGHAPDWANKLLVDWEVFW